MGVDNSIIFIYCGPAIHKIRLVEKKIACCVIFLTLKMRKVGVCHCECDYVPLWGNKGRKSRLPNLKIADNKSWKASFYVWETLSWWFECDHASE